jgi:hypothetical protein
MGRCHWVSGYSLSEGQLQGSGSTTRILNLKHNRHQVLSVPLICLKNCNILQHIYNIFFVFDTNCSTTENNKIRQLNLYDNK